MNGPAEMPHHSHSSQNSSRESEEPAYSPSSTFAGDTTTYEYAMETNGKQRSSQTTVSSNHK
jgi:hypothetical protein